MIEKLTRFVEVVFDVTLNTIKSVLWMLIVTFIAILFIASAFVAAIVRIST